MRRRRSARWGEYALWSAGAILLGYCAWAYGSAQIFQRQAERQLELQIAGARRTAAAGIKAAAIRPAPGSPIGRLEIPAVHLSAIIVEGDGHRELRLGVGHVPGTPLPGEAGNAGLAGHRDTFFRPLAGISQGDEIIVTEPGGSYRYAVESTKIVKPDAAWELAPSRSPRLTLVTCYPFHYIGAAPYRFIVRARKIE
jgi:sortase A